MQREAPPSIPPGVIKITYEEYAELPNDGKRYQVFDGVVDVTPAPVPRHQAISGELELILILGLDRKGLGKTYHAPIDVLLGKHDIVQPDIIFIRKERMKIIKPKFIEGAPDLVIEILSPSTRRTDVLLKSAIYARFAIPSYWIADPDLDRLEVYRLEGGTYVSEGTYAAPAIVRPSAFPGLEIPLAEVFGE